MSACNSRLGRADSLDHPRGRSLLLRTRLNRAWDSADPDRPGNDGSAGYPCGAFSGTASGSQISSLVNRRGQSVTAPSSRNGLPTGPGSKMPPTPATISNTPTSLGSTPINSDCSSFHAGASVPRVLCSAIVDAPVRVPAGWCRPTEQLINPAAGGLCAFDCPAAARDHLATGRSIARSWINCVKPQSIRQLANFKHEVRPLRGGESSASIKDRNPAWRLSLSAQLSSGQLSAWSDSLVLSANKSTPR